MMDPVYQNTPINGGREAIRIIQLPEGTDLCVSFLRIELTQLELPVSEESQQNFCCKNYIRYEILTEKKKKQKVQLISNCKSW